MNRLVLFLEMIAAMGALVALRFFDPATCGWFPPCPFHALTGWFCPGCGSTRALHQLLHGNLRDALALNLLMVLSLPFVVYGAASYAVFQVRGRYLPNLFLSSQTIQALGIIIVIFGIARNIPMRPFNLLAPSGW